MSVSPTNVRALRPMRILLVTDDATFADGVVSLATRRGLHVTLASTEDDLDIAALRHGPNIVVLDAHDALRRTVRAATIFAAVHVGIPVVIVANGAATPSISGLRLIDKWSSAERLLGEVERSYLGLVP